MTSAAFPFPLAVVLESLWCLLPFLELDLRTPIDEVAADDPTARFFFAFEGLPEAPLFLLESLEPKCCPPEAPLPLFPLRTPRMDSFALGFDGAATKMDE